MTSTRQIDLSDIDTRAAAWDVADEILRRVQVARTDLNWNEQLALVDELLAEVGLR